MKVLITGMAGFIGFHLARRMVELGYRVFGIDKLNRYYAADHPVSLYAATERANELMAHSYSHLFGIPSTGLRFFTVYRPWGHPDMALFSFTRAILNGEPIDLYNHGNMERDVTYVGDVVEAVLRVIDRPPNGAADRDGRQSAVSPAPARVYNVGHGEPVSVLDLVRAIEHALGKKAIVREVPIQPGDVPRTWADGSALREELAPTGHTSPTEGVDRFVAWYRRYTPRGDTRYQDTTATGVAHPDSPSAR